MAIDDGHAVHYAAVEPGTPVYGSDEVQVGIVLEVADNYREHILDGFVIETPSGDVRFVDGPEVARTAEGGVTLTIDSAAAAELPPPDPGPRAFRPRRGRLAKLLGGWRRG